MKKSILFAAAMLALGGCVHHNYREGNRINWQCDNDKEFSLRRVAGNAEVYAAGQTYQLPYTAEDTYSNGTVTYSHAGPGATLTGIYGGPYENCHRKGRLLGVPLPQIW